MYLKALIGRNELKGCTSMKDVTSRPHLSRHFSNLRKEQRKKMPKKTRSLSNKICRKTNANHHHLNGEPLYHNDKYVWCIKGSTEKNRTQKTGKLMQISTLTRWREFERHTVNIKDELLRVRLSNFIETHLLLI